jgi:raffinose/stachyose/melibiose transport system permease protein
VKSAKNRLGIVAFLLPAAVIYGIFLLYPMLSSFGLSLFKWNGINQKTFNFGRNFVNLMKDDVFLGSVRHTVQYLMLNILIQIPLALLLAMILSRKILFYKFFRTVLFLPYVVAQSVIAMMFLFVFNPEFGLLNVALRSVGLGSWIQEWLVDPRFALGTIIFVVVWKSFGYYMIILMSGISGIPKEMYEAAEIDGADVWQRETKITLPFLWPFIVLCVTLAAIGAWKGFDIVWVMTEGGVNYSTELLSTFMFRKAFLGNSFGYASSVAVVIFALCIITTLLIDRFFRREQFND